MTNDSFDVPDGLQERYPGLYPGNAYVWFGVGWSAIVERLSEQLAKTDTRVIEMKEKYGGLVVYVEGRDPSPMVEAAIKDACDASWKTCDQCGAPGVLREDANRWLSTRCDRHANGALSTHEARVATVHAAIAEALTIIEVLNRFLDGASSDQYVKDNQYWSATAYKLQHLSDAVRLIGGPTRIVHPEVQWDRLDILGDVYDYGYGYEPAPTSEEPYRDALHAIGPLRAALQK